MVQTLCTTYNWIQNAYFFVDVFVHLGYCALFVIFTPAHRTWDVKILKVCSLHTCQVGHTVDIDFELVAFQMLTDESQQSVQDSHSPCNRGGWRVPIACRRNTQGQQASLKNSQWKICLGITHNLRWTRSLFCFVTDTTLLIIFELLFRTDIPLRRWPTRAKLKLVLKFKPTKWSICLQCHSNGHLISMKTSSGL